jgi:hypothetical protein
MSELEGQHEHSDSHGEQGIQGIPGKQGIPGLSPTGDLLSAVKTLVREVEALSLRLKNDYPTKEEVKNEGRKRAAKSLAFAFCIIIASNLLTIQTVSYCFLSPVGTVHTTCNYIPGYENTTKEGNARLQRFNLLLEQISTNQRSIIDLQHRIKVLEGQG